MSSPDIEHLPYRPCVGAMILNAAGEVFLGHRADGPEEPEGPGTWWQMPQGGIDQDEDPRAAVLRELYEETSIRSVEIIAETGAWLHYDLPPELQGKAWGGRYRGQTQKWYAMRFTGDDSEINVLEPPDGHAPEFDRWKWVSVDELPRLVVPFKREVYLRILREFAHLTGGGPKA